jgi:hypothetical protein
MGRSTILGTAAATAVMLVLPSGAAAAQLHLRGQVVGQPSSKAQITVVKKHGDLTAISSIKFTRVAVTCSDGTSGAISGSDPRTFKIHGKNFTRKTRVLGVGIDHGYFRATGKFRKGGKAVKGGVRFAFKASSGAGCGTGKLTWRASKT